MFDYTSTSRIRRKVRTKFTNIRNRVQEEFIVTLNDFSAVEGENFQQRFKRIMHRKSSSSSSETESSSDDSDSSEDNGSEKKTIKQRFVLYGSKVVEMLIQLDIR